jgi:hypothetical protein
VSIGGIFGSGGWIVVIFGWLLWRLIGFIMVLLEIPLLFPFWMTCCL